MSHLEYQFCYHRNLPHIQPEGGKVFSTFRLAGSLPRPILAQWKEDKKRLMAAIERSRDPVERAHRQIALHRAWFARMERCLDRAQTGPLWLKEPEVAQLVADALHYLDGKKYSLVTHSIMPNHVHAVFTPLLATPAARTSRDPEAWAVATAREATNETSHGRAYHSLASIMHSLKGYTSNRCNSVLNRTGQFWEHESYDHIVRDEAEESRIVEYILNNPVKAGLVECWQDWPWNFWRGAT